MYRRIFVWAVVISLCVISIMAFLGLGASTEPVQVAVENRTSQKLVLWTATLEGDRWRIETDAGMPALPNTTSVQPLFRAPYNDKWRYRLGVSDCIHSLPGTLWEFTASEMSSGIVYRVTTDGKRLRATANRGKYVP